jgi:hypothetical protein
VLATTVGGLTFVIRPSASDLPSLTACISVVPMSSLPLERPTRYCSRQGSRAFTFSGPRTASASASQRSRQVRNGVSERARATGSRQTGWQDEDCRNQGIRFSARHATFLAHRGSLVSVHASSRSMRGVRQGQAALAHAVKISSGGPPIFLVAEEETHTFTQVAASWVVSATENDRCSRSSPTARHDSR